MDNATKEHYKWVSKFYTAFNEGSIHCPGCLSHERLLYEWSIQFLEKKSDRTPLEEQELTFDRLKIGFLDFLYKKLCEKAAKKKAAVIQARLALNRAKQPPMEAPAVAAFSSAAVPAVATSSDPGPVKEDPYC